MRTIIFAAVVAIGAEASRASSREGLTYDEFRRVFYKGQTEASDTVSHAVRRNLYESRKAEIAAHNAQGHSWSLEVNRFADRTDEERSRLLGYKRVGAHRWAESSSSSFLQMGGGDWKAVGVSTGGYFTRDSDSEGAWSDDELQKASDSTVNWGTGDGTSRRLNTSDFVRDQGGCGSCWAVAAVGAIEMHAELAGGAARHLSHQQVVECTPNPKNCGGTGGCNGATSELAFDYVAKAGIPGLEVDKAAGGEGEAKSLCTGAGKPPASGVMVSGFKRLETNSLSSLLQALATTGPVVVSVDASKWMGYGGGVFKGCGKNAIVNHAVLAVGYGDSKATKENPKGDGKYWDIRNSWGPEWGEQGHIRVTRHGVEEKMEGDLSADKKYCGVDNKPKEGVGCDGGPASIPVCGMCGMLSDTSYPNVQAPANVAKLSSPAGAVASQLQMKITEDACFETCMGLATGTDEAREAKCKAHCAKKEAEPAAAPEPN